MVVRMAAQDAGPNLSELLCRVQHGGETVILEEAGKPLAAVIPLEQYEKMMEEREAKFDAFHRSIHDRPAFSEEEVEADIADAIAIVRGKRAPGRT
jgi:prevent-host-death family protein